MFIYQKLVDWSTLRQGFQIPVNFHSLLKAAPGGMPAFKESRKIKIIVDGEPYDALLKNQKFDTDVHEHSEIIQIRYNIQSPLAKRLRVIFSATWDYVVAERNVQENHTIRIPEDRQEFLALSATDMPDVFVADCITLAEKSEAKKEVSGLEELTFETEYTERVDDSAQIVLSSGVRRLRRLDRSIGDSLKLLYDYRCQMTGERIGEEQEALVVEAHHLVPFTSSLNNDSSNIVILSPSYHRIVHKANAEWDSTSLSFRFPNGLVERLKLNKHLLER